MAYVYLVGAGPGDPRLITLKGLDCIKKADCIIYDRLASRRLLSYAKEKCELIDAGKEPDSHKLNQDEINKVLVEKSIGENIVVRLKGGDPFVFGRGAEEAEALVEAGIPFEIVPGITSAIAVAAYAGIPVTHRDYASTFTVITGNENPDKADSSIEWDKISLNSGTLVFLMGMRNMPHIMATLIEKGKAPLTPVALIRWGTRPEQATLTGTISDIAEKARHANFKHPVIIVVGEVVSLREKLKWFEKRPLFGKRVLVTRSRAQASAFAEQIESLGGEPWEFPTIATVDPEDFGPLDAAIANLESYDWLILTSTNGVEKFFERLNFHKKDIRALHGIKLCAIGPTTKAEIEKRGLFIDLMPEKFVAESLLEAFKDQHIQGEKILMTRADIARKALPDTLRQMGAEVDDVVAYRTVEGSGNIEQLMRMLKDNLIHVVTFTSSSTVKNFIKMVGKENIPELLKDVVVASIGPITTQTAEDNGLHVDIQPEEYTIPGLTEAIVDYYKV